MFAPTLARTASQFRSNNPLTVDEIARYAPSVLASEAHESRGERYAYIPTIDVLDGLRKEGFVPYAVAQTRVKDQTKREHTKHLVRMRHESQIGSLQRGGIVGAEEIPEIILVNSHDGTSSFQLMSGMFRLVCSNGLIAGNIQDDIRIRHTGNIIGDVIEGSYQVLDSLKEITERVDHYKGIELSAPEQLLLANAAIDLRWDRDEVTHQAPVDASSLVRPRRTADVKPDLWTTFNRIQEHIIKGGVRARMTNGRRTTTRAVQGVNENVKLNKALWALADGFAALKQSH